MVYHLTQGLLRQLVLLPGSDASPRICPSMNPRLAELAVPAAIGLLPVAPLGNDIPMHPYGEWQTQRFHLKKTQLSELIKFRQYRVILLLLKKTLNNNSLFLSVIESEVRVTLGSRPSCTGTERGQLWFDTLKRGLFLCDGISWLPMLQGECLQDQPGMVDK